MKNKRIVAVFTGNRAEYGLQYPIIKAISEHESLEYRLIVTGAHLQDDFGSTIREIEKDGFTIHACPEIGTNNGGRLENVASAIGSGIINISKSLIELKPDFLVVYADRFEGFAAVVAASQTGIPVVHIEGGDYTEGGALDDSVRHAMTKLSHIHLTTNEMAKQRVLKLGEEDWRVFNIGLPALDVIMAGDFASAEKVYAKFGLDKDMPLIIFTQHSIALEHENASQQIKASFNALIRAGTELGCRIIISYPNNDAGCRNIISEIEALKDKGFPFVSVYKSLGRYFYHGTLNIASVCVGNSSSGIKETPAFKCPCVNIGSRQNGRLKAENVIDVAYDQDQIFEAIKKCIFDEGFKKIVKNCSNPYGEGNSGRRAAEILAQIPLDESLLLKKMTY